ncbi:MAG: dicarboxylate/amino acid:cation symporter, partial [Oscillospiraceae bacterium]|nr:dicarboxylate/amino acid:cation symporter [Oscillospiraceae bacterium]
MAKKKIKTNLTAQIVIGLVLGILVGIVLMALKKPEIAVDYIKPLGTIYLNLIKMIVVPVVLLSIIQGVISLKDIRKVGTIGGRTIGFYLVTTALAVTIGLIFANLLNVGGGYNLATEDLEYAAKEAPPLMDTIVNIFPSNFITPLANATMLQVIVIALFFGFGIILAGEKGEGLAGVVDSAAEVSFKVMGLIISLSGIGVFALMCPVVAQNGPTVLLPLLKVILIAYLCYIIHMVVVYSAAVGMFAKMSPLTFFKGMVQPMIFAFSSASSVGALPLNIEATQQLGVRKDIASFVLPLGATVNMDGTAIYQG